MRPVEFDLRGEDPTRVYEMCRALIGSAGCLLHGSNTTPAMEQLEPRRANDALKDAGNHLAVYATRNVEVVTAGGR